MHFTFQERMYLHNMLFNQLILEINDFKNHDQAEAKQDPRPSEGPAKTHAWT